MTDVWTDTGGKSYYPSLSQEERQVKAILSRDFSASLLNNTKWRELLEPVEELGLSYVIKFVDVAAPMKGSLSHRTDRFYDSNWGPLPIISIEWIEFANPMPEVLALIDELNLPRELRDDAVRVIAHLRKGDPMPPNKSYMDSPQSSRN